MKSTEQQESFLAMLGRCEGAIVKVCLAFTDRQPDNVRDLYQEIVCNLWQAYGRFRRECAENTWVYRIALNTAVTQLRRRGRAPAIVRLTEEMRHSLVDDGDPLRERLYELIDRLNNVDKSLILLVLDGIPYRDIAAITGLREPAARERVYRIKQKLIKLNESENGTVSI